MATEIITVISNGPTVFVDVEAPTREAAIAAAESHVGDYPHNEVYPLDAGAWSVTFDAGHFA